MRLFKEYMLVGGMPKVVLEYAKNGKDFYAADIEKTTRTKDINIRSYSCFCD